MPCISQQKRSLKSNGERDHKFEEQIFVELFSSSSNLGNKYSGISDTIFLKYFPKSDKKLRWRFQLYHNYFRLGRQKEKGAKAQHEGSYS